MITITVAFFIIELILCIIGYTFVREAEDFIGLSFLIFGGLFGILAFLSSIGVI